MHVFTARGDSMIAAGCACTAILRRGPRQAKAARVKLEEKRWQRQLRRAPSSRHDTMHRDATLLAEDNERVRQSLRLKMLRVYESYTRYPVDTMRVLAMLRSLHAGIRPATYTTATVPTWAVLTDVAVNRTATVPIPSHSAHRDSVWLELHASCC